MIWVGNLLSTLNVHTSQFHWAGIVSNIRLNGFKLHIIVLRSNYFSPLTKIGFCSAYSLLSSTTILNATLKRSTPISHSIHSNTYLYVVAKSLFSHRKCLFAISIYTKHTKVITLWLVAEMYSKITERSQ